MPFWKIKTLRINLETFQLIAKRNENSGREGSSSSSNDLINVKSSFLDN